MLSELKLKGNELIIYACIYGFNKTTGKPFSGALNYLKQWTNLTIPSIIHCLKMLVDKGYLIKVKSNNNDIKYYTASKESLQEIVKKLNNGSKESLQGVVKKLNNSSKESLQGCKETLHNNIRYNNDNIVDKIDDKEIIINQSSINELIKVLPQLNIDCDINPNINYKQLAIKVTESDYLINFKSLNQLHKLYDDIINDKYKRWTSSEESKNLEPTRQKLDLERDYTEEELDELLDVYNLDF